MKTGYFGRATEKGYNAKSTQVHIVNGEGVSICGYKPHKTMEFQWCATFAYLPYVECKKCKYLFKTRKIHIYSAMCDCKFCQNINKTSLYLKVSHIKSTKNEKNNIKQKSKMLAIGSFIKIDKYGRE